MNSVIIESLGCPLDPNLPKSWERFSIESTNSYAFESDDEEVEIKQNGILEQQYKKSLESSNSYTSSDTSESDEEETEITQNDVIEQLKKLTFVDVTDSEDVSSKCSNKIEETNLQRKSNSEKLPFVDKREISEDRVSSSSFKNKKMLNNNFKSSSDEDESDSDDDNLAKLANITQQIENISFVDVPDAKRASNIIEKNSSKKHKIEKCICVDNSENKEKRLSSLPLENKKTSNNEYKSTADTFDEAESDSDDDELKESITLRERHPVRHQRPENYRHFRVTPFPQNQSRNIRQYVNPEIHSIQTYQNNHAILNNNNFAYASYDSLNEYSNGIFERSDQIGQSCFPNSLTLTGETLYGNVSNIVANPIVNGVISMTTEQQIVNSVIPRTVTNQAVNGVFQHTVEKEVESVVPSEDEIEYMNDTVSPDLTDVQYFDNMHEKIFSESIDKDCIANNGQKEFYLDGHLEHLNVANILENAEESNASSISSHSFADLIDTPPPFLSGEEVETFFTKTNNLSRLNQNNNHLSTSEENGYPKTNQYTFDVESDHLHSSFSNRNRNGDNNILKNADEFYSQEYSSNKSGSYSNMISQNVTSINCESLSPPTSEYSNISKEIEHEIIKLKEMREWVMRGQNNVAVVTHHGTEFWDILPFSRSDSTSPSECSTSEGASSGPEPRLCKDKEKNKKKKGKNKKNGSKSNYIYQTHNSTRKPDEPKIHRVWRTEAREELIHSPPFSTRIWEIENEKMRRQLENGELGTEEKKVIHFLKKNRKTKYKGTNLHAAVISGNIERVVCIVESHKKCHNTTYEINLRDSSDKTVLDYAKEKKMDLLAQYLEENEAIVGIRV